MGRGGWGGVLEVQSRGEGVRVIIGVYTESVGKHRTGTNPGLGWLWGDNGQDTIPHKWSEWQGEV